MTDQLKDYRRAPQAKTRDELIVSHLPLVKHVLGRLVGELPSGVDIENLESAGVLGLVEAANKFDPDRNAQFKTFAFLRVRGAILDELRRNCPLPQHVLERVTKIRRAYRDLPAPVSVEELSRATELTVDEVTDTLAAMRMTKMVSWEQTAQPNGLGLMENAEPPEAELERWERIQMLTDAIESLDERSRMVITLYHKEDLRLKEISVIMKLSESRISRILTAAMFELGERVRGREAKSDGSALTSTTNPA
ncbi:sigma-70 family RNA polymerase sigma factor [Zavarzinella formosa]|uniref:sigma-70 family RNA polymerase sigma factor n=1 Tax=Zavarzinella formosa TaxID=360055 RepID=UPI001EE66CE3|nr:sigma-70 family RNA polymerase sigma factor [Zavarzinella formosa]